MSWPDISHTPETPGVNFEQLPDAAKIGRHGIRYLCPPAVNNQDTPVDQMLSDNPDELEPYGVEVVDRT